MKTMSILLFKFFHINMKTHGKELHTKRASYITIWQAIVFFQSSAFNNKCSNICLLVFPFIMEFVVNKHVLYLSWHDMFKMSHFRQRYCTQTQKTRTNEHSITKHMHHDVGSIHTALSHTHILSTVCANGGKNNHVLFIHQPCSHVYKTLSMVLDCVGLSKSFKPS